MPVPEPFAENLAQLRRAVLATVRQELGAPITVIIGYAEMLLEDAAARPELAEFAADLQRVLAAGRQLTAFVDRLVENVQHDGEAMTEDAFRAWLRHDLLTPVNAVRGYAELMLESAEDRRVASFAADLRHLVAAADALMRRIEDVVTLDVAGAPAGPHRLQGLELLKQSLMPEVMSAMAPLTRAAPSRRVPPGRILVADDNDSNRDLLCRRLERDGHSVVAVENGFRALAVACAQELDLVLLDLMMPRLNGFEVLTRMRADARTAHLPVIMVSALDAMESIVRCIEAGAEDYLPKPWNPVILRARVNACLEKKMLHDRERQHRAWLEASQRKSEALLLNVLPRPVVERLQRGESVIADRYDEATVLFADIVGFTQLSAGLPAARVAEILNAIFTAFDRLAHEIEVEKIKTVGDAYMAVAGVPTPCADHADRAARLALGMAGAAARAGAALGHELRLRIGLHSGPVVAGIVGTHKFAYDVWGDAVNVASRMEANGVPGAIQASHETYMRLRGRFDWAPRGTVEVKGKGPVAAWLLKGAASRSAAD